MKEQQKSTLLILLGLALLVAVGYIIWSQTEKSTAEINSFAECEAAGYPVMESYPRQCRANDQTFVEEVQTEPDGGICVDNCGDGQCAEIVCLGTGCPCAETSSSCPADCK